MRHCNIPVFIPHMGCPHQCVFCNQRSISGCGDFCESDVSVQIEHALSTMKGENHVEIAFFGGSFTGIDRSLMIRLLDLAQAYVNKGVVHSIRLSTRPDYISDEILEILSRYPVKTIELGLQSMKDEVLSASGRGHTARQATDAARSILDHGFSLVGQVMIGLPRATGKDEIATAHEVAELGVSAVRIYPTVVFQDTPLCDMTKKGLYHPLSVSEAVTRSADVLSVFLERKIPCIRLGLCAGEALCSEKEVYAGPNHPAIGELVMSECLRRMLTDCIQESGMTGDITLSVPERSLSRVLGKKRTNLLQICRDTGIKITRVTPVSGLDHIILSDGIKHIDTRRTPLCI